MGVRVEVMTGRWKWFRPVGVAKICRALTAPRLPHPSAELSIEKQPLVKLDLFQASKTRPMRTLCQICCATWNTRVTAAEGECLNSTWVDIAVVAESRPQALQALLCPVCPFSPRTRVACLRCDNNTRSSITLHCITTGTEPQ
jgi:hypothetical protein